MTLRVDDAAYRTDTGRQRNANEDSLFTRNPVFVIADGMGGAQAGEVASKAAAESFDRELPQAPPEQILEQTIKAANRAIHEQAQRDPDLAGMGTTTTAAIVDPVAETVVIGHVGDSRAYRLREGKFERLTRDHSLVEEMRRKGQLTEAQAEDHPQRSIITRALGPEPEVEVDLQTVPALAGDVFLICSDGLTTMLDDAKIAHLLSRATTMESAVRTLVDEANRAGGRDNISVITFRLEDADAPETVPGSAAEGATLIGASAEEEGLTAAEVRRRAAAEAARQRRESVPEKKSRRGLKRAAKIIAALIVVAAIGYGAWYGNRQVYFLGTDEAGRVALYRGMPYELPFGWKLYSERYASPIQTDSLAPRRQESVTGHDLRSREDAVSLIEDIERAQGVK